MSPNAGYWERELKEATDRLKRLEREQDQINPLVYEELRRREEEVKLCAAQVSLAHQKDQVTISHF
jgi:hypothetical protein